MSEIFFAREIVCAQSEHLLNTPIAEGDSPSIDQLNIMGCEFRAEAHPSRAARDAKLGPDGKYFEFIAATAEEVEASGYQLCRMAIGPSLRDKGFGDVAPRIIHAAIDNAIRWSGPDFSFEVTIARTLYHVQMDRASGAVEVAFGWPYGRESDEQKTYALERDTAMWLSGFVAARSSRHPK